MRVCIVSMGFLLVVGALGCDSAGRDEVISEVASKPELLTTGGRDAAINAVEKLAGRVGYDEKSQGRPLVFVNLEQTEVADADLEYLKGLASLRELHFGQTHVTDAGLEHLKGLTGLKSLWLEQTRVTDVGLAHLKGLKNLNSLYLRQIQVTDAGLVHLKGLTRLQVLDVSSTQVTDGGVQKPQQSLPNCGIKR